MALNFKLKGSETEPVFDFGRNHINNTPSGVLIDGVKYPDRIIDTKVALGKQAPTHAMSKYKWDGPATEVTPQVGWTDVSKSRLTSSATDRYGEDRLVLKHDRLTPPPKLDKDSKRKGGGFILALSSRDRDGYNIVLKRNKDRYGELSTVLYSDATDSFDTVFNKFSKDFGGLFKIKTLIGSFVTPDDMGTCFEIFICIGNIFGDVPDDMMLFPLCGMTNIKEIEKCNLPSVHYILEISARFSRVLLNALTYGRFRYLCDNKPKA
jgi:hypothetical protein